MKFLIVCAVPIGRKPFKRVFIATVSRFLLDTNCDDVWHLFPLKRSLSNRVLQNPGVPVVVWGSLQDRKRSDGLGFNKSNFAVTCCRYSSFWIKGQVNEKTSISLLLLFLHLCFRFLGWLFLVDHGEPAILLCNLPKVNALIFHSLQAALAPDLDALSEQAFHPSQITIRASLLPPTWFSSLLH